MAVNQQNNNPPVQGNQPPQPAAVFALLDEDLNGDPWIGSQEGETLINVEGNVYVFPPNLANDTLLNSARNVNWSRAFVGANYRALVNAQVEGPKAAKIAYLRLLAVRHGLVDPTDNLETYHVNYREVRVLQNMPVIPNDADVAINNALPQVWRNWARTHFTDLVCLVAFVFRARGHHYMDSLAELYERVWQKCRYDVQTLGLSWEQVATVCFHAIFPMKLDDFWRDQVAQGHVNGALAKRFDCAPAGNAGPYVLMQGIKDITMVAPGLRHELKEGAEYLDNHVRLLGANRFNGSVNARYYGAERLPLNESKVAAIAATIKAALEGLAPNSQLLRSAALRRIAGNAPITGAVFARAISRLPDREEVINALIVPDA